ncbi:hypothetical protein ICL16_14385 [Iningainema sp. BLCCT55]|uniref:Excinuclease ABC subunit A n=1 Tax=Iningainema tapete BLCC-T55 TaxID=2748662 RepID=A0A8J6XKI0_9CYAN|nr:hypothetical protein [Iningainema tapete]MBD2773224.1 hypothetical protein [Iningainema tapete BLCC-T55]
MIDLGPEGGDKGGEVIAVGTPEYVAENSQSYTGQYLKQVLQQYPPTNHNKNGGNNYANSNTD